MAREPEAARIIKKLMAENMSPLDISKALGERVSVRTVYRWLNGETEPQRKSDLQALRDLDVSKT